MANTTTSARRAVPFLVASVLAKPVGFLKEMLVAAIFGSGVPRDAFLIAWQIPNLAGSLILEGMPQVLVPYLAEIAKQDNHRRILAGLLGVLAACFVVLSLLLFAGAGPLVGIVAPFAGEATRSLATALLRIMAFSVALMGASAVLTGLLFARQKFVAAALAVPLMNVVIMVVVVLGQARWGIHALAYAVLLGTAAMAVFLVRGATGLPRLPGPSDLRAYRPFFVLLSAFFLGTLLFNLNAIIEKIFASTLPAGNISNLDYAFRLVQMLFTLLGVIPTFLFPRLCELAADEQGSDGYTTLISKAAQATLLLALPLGAVLWAVRLPLVTLVYQRGAFDAAAAAATANLVGWYGLGIAAQALNNLLVHAFYARREMRVRVGYGLVFLAANTTANFVLIRWLGARAIAIASTSAACLCSVYLLVLLRRRMGTPLQRFGTVMWKSGLTAIVLAALLVAVQRVLPPSVLVQLGVAAVVAGGGFLLAARALRIEGAVYLWDLLKMARLR
jgi:putative peptidoglycan lipid II flippase